jgi:hypothetical protein
METQNMTYDPIHTYSALGGYSGIQNPYLTPYASLLNPALNPLAGISQLAQGIGIPQAGQSPFGGLQQGFPQQQGISPFGGLNPLAMQLHQNPLILAALQNPWLAAQIGLPQLQQLQQQQVPYPQTGQFGNPFAQTGYPLAPQSWVGQVGQQQGFQPLGHRPFGFNPLGF